MEQDIIILSASNWNMVDETTGEVRKGTTLWYMPKIKQCVNPDGTCGQTPAKVILDYEYLETVKAHGGAPVDAKATFVIRTRKNQMVMEIVNITYPGKQEEMTDTQIIIVLLCMLVGERIENKLAQVFKIV